jgi:hypothetical protein
MGRSYLEELLAGTREGVPRVRVEEHPEVLEWKRRLRRVRGRLGVDNIERVTSAVCLDMLELSERRRVSVVAKRRLAKVMILLGWTPGRVRGLSHRGFEERVSGFTRACEEPDYWRLEALERDRQEELRAAHGVVKVRQAPVAVYWEAQREYAIWLWVRREKFEMICRRLGVTERVARVWIRIGRKRFWGRREGALY